MLISVRVLMTLAARDFTSSLNRASGQAARGGGAGGGAQHLSIPHPHPSPPAGTISMPVPPLWALTVSEEDVGSSVLGGGGILEVVDKGVDGLEERGSSWAGQEGTVGLPPGSG